MEEKEPVIQIQQVLSNMASPPEMINEINRLQTFKNWPNQNITPSSLAKAGFYYLNRSDEVRCAWCRGVIAKWEQQDDPYTEHRRFFPECPYILQFSETTGDGDLGIQQISPPKKPKFSSLGARLLTYYDWPINEIQRPEALAQAGLYYQHVDDQVRCFHCNIGLRSWQKEDDPFYEHAKWYPQCQFVRLVKGSNYVESVQEATKKTIQPTATLPPALDVDEAMTTSPVLKALEIGIEMITLRNVTQRQLLRTGRPYDTVEDLLKAVFDNSDESTVGSGGDGSSTSCASDNENQNNTCNSNSSDAPTNVAAKCQSIKTTAAGTIGDINVTKLSQHDLPSTSAAAVLESTKDKDCATNAEKKDASKTTEKTEACLLLEQENQRLKDARLCKVCLDEEVGVVFLPCGHLVACVQCAPGVTSQCPLCRQVIKGFVRTYLS